MKKVTDEQINDMVTDLIKAMETDMPAAAESYKPINRYINLPMDDKDDMDIVCRYGLRVYQMPLDLQPDASISYVEDYALAVDGYKASMIVKMGKKDALLDFLRAEGLTEKLQDDYKRLFKLLTED